MGTPIDIAQAQLTQEAVEALIRQEAEDLAYEREFSFLDTLDKIEDLIDSIRQVMSLKLSEQTIIALECAFYKRIQLCDCCQKEIEKNISQPVNNGTQSTSAEQTQPIRADAGASVERRPPGVRRSIRPSSRSSRR